MGKRLTMLSRSFCFALTSRGPCFAHDSGCSLSVRLPVSTGCTVFNRVGQLSIAGGGAVLATILVISTEYLLSNDTMLVSMRRAQIGIRLISKGTRFGLLAGSSVCISRLSLNDS